MKMISEEKTALEILLERLFIERESVHWERRREEGAGEIAREMILDFFSQHLGQNYSVCVSYLDAAKRRKSKQLVLTDVVFKERKEGKLKMKGWHRLERVDWSDSYLEGEDCVYLLFRSDEKEKRRRYLIERNNGSSRIGQIRF